MVYLQNTRSQFNPVTKIHPNIQPLTSYMHEHEFLPELCFVDWEACDTKKKIPTANQLEKRWHLLMLRILQAQDLQKNIIISGFSAAPGHQTIRIRGAAAFPWN